MSAKWYYVENDNEVGPVSAAVIKEKVRTGVISPSDEVWKEGLPDWVPASKIKGLFPDNAAAGAAPPPAPAAGGGGDDDWLSDLPDPGAGERLPDAPLAYGDTRTSTAGYSDAPAPLADRLSGRGYDFEYGGFWERFVAAFIDGILMNIIGFVIGFIGGFIGAAIDGPNGQGGVGFVFVILAQILSIIITYGYYVIMESSASQATLGKQAMGLIVTDLDGNRISVGRAIGRNLAEILSSITLLIGYIMQPFTERKQALHDMIAGTLVCKR